MLREIPRVTQVEKGHEGNITVATAYICWVKHGHRSSRTGVPADYCKKFLLKTLIVFGNVRL